MTSFDAGSDSSSIERYDLERYNTSEEKLSLIKSDDRQYQPSRKTPRDKKSKYKSVEEIDQEALAKFVSDNGIKQHECSDYVRDPKSETNNCMCGRSQEWHEKEKIDVHKHKNSPTLWSFNTHTKTFPADSFGIINFQGFGQETLSSPYIRLSPETKLETLWTLMTHHWKIPIPKLLISVTGGAQRFDLNPRLQAVFKEGLINAATSTGAWIITGGTATGVMRIIGDAVRNHRITSSSTTNEIIALGIATWGCIANRDALDGEGDRGLFPATYSLEDVPEITNRVVPLDHNHTHFILVDNGPVVKFGAEIEFRSAFEQFVSDKVVTGVAQSQSVKVPVVLLVVEGGVNTMLTVYKSIQKNIPVLVFNGSGRAADFIAKGYDLTKDPKNEDKSQYPANFDEVMMKAGKEMFAWKQSDNVEKNIKGCIKQLKDTLDNRKLVNIFNLGEAETKDIDRAILYALLKANKTNANAQLSLALAWNRCDIARHEIFTKENRQYWKNIPLYDAMFSALVQDRVDFVQLFLENGVSLKKFLSIDTLWNLYRIE